MSNRVDGTKGTSGSCGTFNLLNAAAWHWTDSIKRNGIRGGLNGDYARPFSSFGRRSIPPFIQDSRVVCPKVLMPESVSASLIDGWATQPAVALYAVTKGLWERCTCLYTFTERPINDLSSRNKGHQRSL